MKLTIYGEDALVFEPPVLLEVGPERVSLGGENSTIMVYLDNAVGQVTELLTDPMLRSQCELESFDSTFYGILHSVVLGSRAELSIEI